MTAGDPVDDLLDALGVLRRFWERPDRKRRFMVELGEQIELGVLRAIDAVSALTAATDDEPGVGAVAERLDVDVSTASRLVDAAVIAGHLDRHPSATDRRRNALGLTDSGAALVERSLDIRRRWLATITADWSTDDLVRFAELSRRFVEAARPEAERR